MRGATCFSGIGCPEVGMPWVDWLWSADVDPFANAVRDVRFPDMPNLGDVTADDFMERAAAFGPLDVLVGGPPCQDFSVAGLRAGIHGDRGNLTLRWLEIVHALRPRWAVTENVPGWLSANKGHAFGAFVAGLVGHDTAILPPKECGGRWTNAGMAAGPLGRCAWRILDASRFGVPQRRHRVFLVFCPGDRDDPAAVLLERKGGDRDPASRRAAGEGIAGSATACAGDGSRQPAEERGLLVAAFGGNNTAGPIDVATACNAHGVPHGRLDFESETFIAHTLRGEGFDAGEDGTGRGTPLVPVVDPAFIHVNKGRPDGRKSAHTEMVSVKPHVETLTTDGHSRSAVFQPPPIAFHPTQDPISGEDVCHALGTGAKGGCATAAVAVPLLETGKRTGRSSADAKCGSGIGEPGDPMFTLGTDSRHGVAFAENSRAELRLEGGGGKTTGALKVGGGKPGRSYPAILVEKAPDTIYGVSHGDASSSPRSSEALRALRDAVGAEAFTAWGLGIAAALRAAEVLRPEVHGGGIRREAEQEFGLVHHALARSQDYPGGAVLALWQAGCPGCSPPGWEPPEQLAWELGARLPRLPHQGAQAEGFLLDLWRAAEGLGLLREALSAVQEAWRSACGEGQSVCGQEAGDRSQASPDLLSSGLRGQDAQQGHVRQACSADKARPAPAAAVRRLLPIETERLQGLPDDWTKIPWRGRPAEECPDGPRYRAVGNGMAVPCLTWIGRRLTEAQRESQGAAEEAAA